MSDDLKIKSEKALRSFRTVFTIPVDGKLGIKRLSTLDSLEMYYAALKSLNSEKSNGDTPDTIDYYNALFDKTNGNINGFLERSLLELFVNEPYFIDQTPDEITQIQRARNVLTNAQAVYENSLPVLVHLANFDGSDRIRGIEESRKTDGWENEDWTSKKFIEFLQSNLRSSRVAGAFEYRDGTFVPYHLRQVKPLNKFFGYPLTKKRLKEHFESFILGNPTSPILMDGPPGIGKTELLLTFSNQYLIPVVVADPEYIEKSLPRLLVNLGERPQKSLLFFDDIDPEKVNWHYFRASVSGTGEIPKNVSIAIVTNYQFPENIKSRGTYIPIPEFTRSVALDIIKDYLNSVKIQKPEFAELLLTSYLRSFKSARTSTEISPRSLVRHMDDMMSSIEKKQKLIIDLPSKGYSEGIGVTEKEFNEAYEKSLIQQGYKNNPSKKEVD